MKLHFTPRARLDLIGIADYIRTRNPAAALAVRQAILGSLQSVASFLRSAGSKASRVSANSSPADIVT